MLVQIFAWIWTCGLVLIGLMFAAIGGYLIITSAEDIWNRSCLRFATGGMIFGSVLGVGGIYLVVSIIKGIVRQFSS